MGDVRLGIGYIGCDLDAGSTGALRNGRDGEHEKLQIRWSLEHHGRSMASCQLTPSHVYAFNTSQAGHTLPHTRHHRRVRHKYSLFYPWLQSDQPHSGSAQGGARTAIARMRTPLEVARIDHTSCLAHASGRPSPSTAVVPSSRTPPNCLLPILTSCSPVAQRFGTWAEHDGSLSGSTDAVL